MKTNRRKCPRVPLDTNAMVYINGTRLVCSIVDVSRDGMALECPFPFEPGKFLQIDFTLPDVPRWVSVKAVLVRTQRNESSRVWGLKFKALHQKAAKLISRYVSEKRAACATGTR